MILKEAAKAELIKRHTAKKKELETKVSDTMAVWHAAQRELDAHTKTHPNYAAMQARKAAKVDPNAGYEEGRSAARKNGNW